MRNFLSIILRVVGRKINTIANHLEVSKPNWNEKNYRRWFDDEGDRFHILNHDLNESSLVIEAGGFTGVFSQNIFSRYNCNLIVFEPVPEYCQILKEKFQRNLKVIIIEKALTLDGKDILLSIQGDASGAYKNNTSDFISVPSVNLSKFLMDERILEVDLMNINIEGGEYELLENLLAHGLQSRVRNIQVQFHNLFEGAQERMEKIQLQLSNTHELAYQYHFVWECWKIKSNA